MPADKAEIAAPCPHLRNGRMDRISPKQRVLSLQPDASLVPATMFSGAKTYRISTAGGWLTGEHSTAFSAWSEALQVLSNSERTDG